MAWGDLIEASPIATVIIDSRGIICFANAGSQRLFGWPRGALVGRTFHSLVVDADALLGARAMLVRATCITESGRQTSAQFTVSDLEHDGAVYRVCSFVSVEGDDVRFRELAESLPHMIWTCDRDGRCDYLGPQWVAYTGIPESEQLGTRWVAQMHPDEWDALAIAWRDAMATGTPLDVTHRIRRHDGVYRWFKTLATPVKNESGVVLKWYGTNTDIQDLRDAQTEAQRANTVLEERVAERTRALSNANAARVVHAALSASAAIATSVQELLDGLVATLCIELGGLCGTGWMRVGQELRCAAYYEPPGRPARDPAFQIASRDKRAAAGRGLPGRVMRDRTTRFIPDVDDVDEEAFPRRSAALRAGIRAGVAFPVTLDGEVELIIECFFPKPTAADDALADALWAAGQHVGDALRRLHAEQELQRSAALQRMAVEHASSALIATDTRGLVTLFNPAAERLLGYTAAEVIGILTPSRFHDPTEMEAKRRAVAERYHVPLPSPLDAWTLGAREHEEGDTTECHYVRKDGSRVQIMLTIRALRDRVGAVVGYLGAALDLDATLSVERARQAEVRLQEVHHRVKNNLQVIASLVRMQLRQMQDPSARTALEETQARVQSIALIHELTYQTKDYTHVPFGTYVETLARTIFAAAAAANVKLEMHADAVTLPIDKAVPCGLVLNELLTNSLKHGFPAGRHGVIRVDLSASADAISLVVSDDGKGLDPDYDSRAAKSLGMQLVHALTSQLGGTLDVVRAPQLAFRLRFPR